MFAENLCDSPWANRSHRGWTTLASFALQAFAVGTLLLLPLLYTAGLPTLQPVGALVMPVPAPALPPPAHPRAATASASDLASNGEMISPPRIPDHVAAVTEASAPEPVDLGGLRVRGGMGSSAGGGVWRSPGDSLAVVAPPSVPAVTHPARVSRMMEGNLIHRVQPDYPSMAKIEIGR